MNVDSALTNSTPWQQQAHQQLLQGSYAEAASLYEQAIATEPEIKSYYWHMGLALLLNGQETEAQTVWMMGMMEDDPEELAIELVQVLKSEAERRETLNDYSVAWLIRQHIKEIAPGAINNLLILLLLAIELKRFEPEDIENWGLLEQLQSGQIAEMNANLLMELLHKVLECAIFHPAALELATASVPHAPDAEILISILLPKAIDVNFTTNCAPLAARLAELCLQKDPQNAEVMAHLATFYQDAREFANGIETAKQRYELVKTLPEKIHANHLILRGLMSAAGYWQEARSIFDRQETLLLSLAQADLSQAEQIDISRLSNSAFFFPYFRDDLRNNRTLQNQIARTYLENIGWENAERVQQYQQPRLAKPATDRRLKIGYLSHCLCRHSVGWLARTLFQHQDRDRFELYGYFVSYRQNDHIQEWYTSQVEHAHKWETIRGENTAQIAEQVYQDGIDILIDLDSITLDFSFDVMARKPAPVQATWLGWDASGLSTIDYFIADPYVLPDFADEAYQEKIWRLPQTYIGLDGFEVAIPTLRRDDLGIPQDAVIYFSSQNGYKRNPDIARLQMQILKAVPNSYFLIKGISDQDAVQRSFSQIAEDLGISYDRLRFLPEVASEAVHRANLAIADVVLDTFPYNGATTTLETLWMEVPLVTRVGEHFSSRNSYTMLINAGVTEGIAWSDAEYIEWGIRLGTDPALRQKVSWKLRQAKQTAPLWNGKQFAREMEKAYEQMWERYLELR
ncbi:MAG: O-linked N-acetylglucosamine transferase, SPINDLY family protein [Scytolyngbya sp. HA4215-MV1]|nr:O-linked N-acetylglucosamine transferase, SPINDLY family protein [Scytolyngbya sp. HA4215-MV1]